MSGHTNTRSGTQSATPMNAPAFIAGWVFPGLGHIISGRTQRGIYAMIGVMGLVLTGLLVGGIDAVDSKSGADRYWYMGQVLAGPSIIGINYVHQTNFKAYDMTTSAYRGGYPNEKRVHNGSRWIWEPMTEAQIESGTQGDAIVPGLGRLNEIAMLSITLGGMLNLIVMLDALFPGLPGSNKDDEPDQDPEPTPAMEGGDS